MRRVAPAVGLSLLALSAAMTAGCDMDAAYHQTYGFAPGALPVVARPSAPASSAPTSPALRYAAVGPATAPNPAAPRLTGSPVVLATDATFDREYSTSPVPVVINFTAKWCGPCHGVSRTLDQLAVEKAGRVKVLRVDFDQSPGLVRRYGISALPAVLVVRDGVVVKRMVGSQSRDNLSAAVSLVAP
jgi:thioredoxin